MILVGMLTGIISSFFGIGGGSIIVPFLVSLFPAMSFESIVATSLAAIFVNAIIIVIKSHHMGEKLTRKNFFSMGIPSLIGAFTGSFILPNIGSLWPKRLFVLILVISILRSFIKYKNSHEANEMETTLNKYIIIGFVGGFVSSLTGLGGGVVIVPMLMFLTRIKINKHTLISQNSMIFSTFAGVVTHTLVPTEVLEAFLPWATLGRINWAMVILLQAGSFMTTSWGLRQNQKVKPHLKKILLIILYIILGTKIFISTL
jgi:uncharacterized membrane protein YfcA